MSDVPQQSAGPVSFGKGLREWLGFSTPPDEEATDGGHLPRLPELHPGAASGIEHDELTPSRGGGGPVTITCIDFSPDRFQVEEVADVDDFLARHRPEWAVVRWMNIDGLSDMKVLRAFSVKYDLHPLVVEDVVHVGQRPKAEDYPNTGEHQARLFIIARMLKMVEGHVRSEQVSFVLGHKTLLTFQERQGDIWDPIRQRIGTKGSRLRQNDVSFLIYALLDALIDQCFPILEFYSEQLEELEDQVLYIDADR